MGFGVTWSSGRCSCPISKISSNLNYAARVYETLYILLMTCVISSFRLTGKGSPGTSVPMLCWKEEKNLRCSTEKSLWALMTQHEQRPRAFLATWAHTDSCCASPKTVVTQDTRQRERSEDAQNCDTQITRRDNGFLLNILFLHCLHSAIKAIFKIHLLQMFVKSVFPQKHFSCFLAHTPKHTIKTSFITSKEGQSSFM